MNISLEQLFKNSFVLSIDEERFNLFKKIFEHRGLPIPKKYEGFSFSKYQVGSVFKDVDRVLNCSYGHASIIKLAQYLDLPFVCIFKDDAYPCFDIKNKLEYYLTGIPDDCECMLLGNNGCIKCKKYNQKFIKIFNSGGSGSHAYIVFKNGYDKILNNYNSNCISDMAYYQEKMLSPAYNLFIQYNSNNDKSIHSTKQQYIWFKRSLNQIFKEFPRVENIILQDIDLPENKNKNRFLKIVIPCYNCQNTIRIMVNSILSQTCKDFFIVLVDDMSTDNTFQMLKEYEQKYPDYIKAVQVPKKEYADGAREFGFKQYDSAEFTWFVDADDSLANINVIQILKNNNQQNNYDIYTFNSKQHKFNIGGCWFAPWFRIVRSNNVVFHTLNICPCDDIIQTIMQFDSIPNEKIYHINEALYDYSGSHNKMLHQNKDIFEKLKSELKNIQLKKNIIKNIVKKMFGI